MAAISIALASLIASVITLYLNHLRTASIDIRVGPLFKIYYTGDQALSFYLPITFFNRALKAGAVGSVELVLVETGGREYRFPWRSFSAYDDASDNWKYSDLVHTIAVPGASTVKQTIWFSWPEGSQEQPTVQTGANEFRVRYEVLPQGKFKEIERKFVLSPPKASALETYRTERQSTTVDVLVGEHPLIHEIVEPDGTRRTFE